MIAIEGFSKYGITLDGRVFNLKTKRELAVFVNSCGYKHVSIFRDDGKRKMMKAHRLVALTFIKNPKKRPEVDHLNGDKLDNYYKNLKWVNRSENCKHEWSSGIQKKDERFKKHVYNNGIKSRRFSAKQLSKIKKMKREGLSNRAIARAMECSHQTINDIINKKRYVKKAVR